MPFPADQSLIEAAEKQLGRRLPEELRLRLTRENGGEIEIEGDDWTLHSVWDPTNRRTMARTTNHIVRETEYARTWPHFPDGGIALASDGAGNRLLLRPGSSGIEIWDHETGSCRICQIDWSGG